MPAALEEADDTKPHYTETSGDYLYKMPDEGVAALDYQARNLNGVAVTVKEPNLSC